MGLGGAIILAIMFLSNLHCVLVFIFSPSGGGKEGAREGSRPGRHFAGAAFEGGKFGILAFALQRNELA